MSPTLSTISTIGPRSRKALCGIVLFVFFFSFGGPQSGRYAGEASAQSLSEEILDTVKRAQRFLLGERPCGARLSLKWGAWSTVAEGVEGRVLHVTLSEGKSP